MKINTVAILGAGAIGSYFIWGLSEKLGENLWVIAEGERKERLEKDGLTINGEKYVLHVKTPEEAKGADLLLVATKYGELRAAVEVVERVIDPHTIVMSLLNGVDSEEIIGKRIGMEPIVHAFMKISSERKGSNVIFNGPATPGIYFGEASTKEVTPRMQAICEVFADSKVGYHTSDDIVRQIWYKYSINVSQNQPQAIINCGHGAYYDSEYVGKMRELLLKEVKEVALAKGIDLSAPNHSTEQHAHVRKNSRFSTLQDLDARRHTEVEMFAGTMVRMGKELGIPTPYNEFTYLAIKALEEKNDGKFDYQ